MMVRGDYGWTFGMAGTEWVNFGDKGIRDTNTDLYRWPLPKQGFDQQIRMQSMDINDTNGVWTGKNMIDHKLLGHPQFAEKPEFRRWAQIDFLFFQQRLFQPQRQRLADWMPPFSTWAVATRCCPKQCRALRSLMLGEPFAQIKLLDKCLINMVCHLFLGEYRF